MIAFSSSSLPRFVVSLFLLFSSLVAVEFVTAGTNEAGVAFLAENKGQPGVIELPSGLQYKVLRKGKGTAYPTANSPCSCHYEGKLLDGTVFDSSYKRGNPSTFAPSQVVKGWTEAMQMMVVGDKWEMYIPSELAYGDRGSPPKIGGGDALIFIMEILAISGNTVPALKCSIITIEENDNDNDSEEESGNGSECNERETLFISKVKLWLTNEEDKPAKELKRIQTILGSPMKDELRDWARRRVNILEQFVAAAKQENNADAAADSSTSEKEL